MRRVDVGELSPGRYERRARLGVADDAPIRCEAEYTEEIKRAVNAAYVAKRVSVSADEHGVLLDGVPVKSDDLAAALRGCSSGYILVGTLGFDVDRYLISAASDAYRLFVTDAIADCLIEALLDYAEQELGDSERFTNRFSAGYGDLDLAYGRVLVSMSGADKELGIRFTESGLMSPRKSVNAVIGIKDREEFLK